MYKRVIWFEVKVDLGKDVRESDFQGGPDLEFLAPPTFALIATKNGHIVDKFFWMTFFDKYLIKFELNSFTCDNS